MKHVLRHRLAIASIAVALSALPIQAQTAAPTANSDGGQIGGEILAAKCAQCHTDSMWRDQRQSAKAWEATLYRMIGRGALWEPEEVRQMAAYLGADFGPNVAKAAASVAK